MSPKAIRLQAEGLLNAKSRVADNCDNDSKWGALLGPEKFSALKSNLQKYERLILQSCYFNASLRKDIVNLIAKFHA